MRTSISLPDDLYDAARRRLGGESFSEFARRAIAERIEKLERGRLEKAMAAGYRAERDSPSLDPLWENTEAEPW